jgi:hypothetical protein
MRTPDGRIFDVKGTGHPVPGLGKPAAEIERPKARVAGVGGGAAPLGFFGTASLGGDWSTASSEDLVAPDPIAPEPSHDAEPDAAEATSERKRLSEAKTLEKEPREPEPSESVESILERAREHASHGRHGEALHLVGLALGREPGSIEARVLKRHLLHAMGTASPMPLAGSLGSAAKALARPAAAIGALIVLSILAFALGTWRSRAPEPSVAQQRPPQQPAASQIARHEPPASVPRATDNPRPSTTAVAATPTATPTAPAAEVAATTARGTLVFDVPAGSEISLDGKPVGTAPLSGVEVSDGLHDMVLRRADLGVLRRMVTAYAGRRTRISISEAFMRDAHGAAQERLARRAFTDGHRERALAITNAALQIVPTHQGLHDVLALLVRDAMNQAIAARKAAERAGRGPRRSGAFEMGDSHFQRAERFHDANRPADAIPAYWAAQTQFERATAEGRK